MKRLLIKINWFLAEQLGINFWKFFKSIKGFFCFARDYFIFSKNNCENIELMPCLHDKHSEAGAVSSGYFWMDLTVARWIFENKPKKHVDIGSRIDGFVAHIASFRDLDVVDIRPISSCVPGVNFVQADAMSDTFFRSVERGNYDSVSCLYALEHFGLGRYGDSIDPDGYKTGIKNISQLLSVGGTLYLSVPVGRQRVEFNANWVFDPNTIIACCKANNLILKSFGVVSPETGLEDVQLDKNEINKISNQEYAFGVFNFKKN